MLQIMESVKLPCPMDFHPTFASTLKRDREQTESRVGSGHIRTYETRPPAITLVRSSAPVLNSLHQCLNNALENLHRFTYTHTPRLGQAEMSSAPELHTARPFRNLSIFGLCTRSKPVIHQRNHSQIQVASLLLWCPRACLPSFQKRCKVNPVTLDVARPMTRDRITRPCPGCCRCLKLQKAITGTNTHRKLLVMSHRN